MRLLFYILFLALVFPSCQSSSENDNANGDGGLDIEEGVEKVQFKSKDGLEISADFYYGKSKDKVILLCHQAGFSRGSYVQIAPRLVQAGFSCLAVDLRSGAEVNGIINETHQRAEDAGLATNYEDSRQDILASLDYLKARGVKKVVLWGSSYSATLSLMVGRDHPMVVKVVAISPGVYFGTADRLLRAVTNYSKPVFVTCAKAEENTAMQLVSVIQKPYLNFVLPKSTGDHGSKMFWQRNEVIDELFNQIVAFI